MPSPSFLPSTIMESYMQKVFVLIALVACFVSLVRAQDTVQVKAGWNNIGSVRTVSISVDLCTDPPGIIVSSFFGYEPGVGYQSSGTLQKGLGYWVKVSSDGKIVFNGTCSGGGGACSTPNIEYGGVIYNTVAIGDQCWLKKNLNLGVMIDSSQDATDNGMVEKYCYQNNPAYCDTFGGLYQWDEMMQYTSDTPGSRGICPPGWHIPILEEFQALFLSVGYDGNALKAQGQGSGDGAGTNTSGFSVLLAGYRDVNGRFQNLGNTGSIWSSTDVDANYSYYQRPVAYSNYISHPLNNQLGGFSVRCIED